MLGRTLQAHRRATASSRALRQLRRPRRPLSSSSPPSKWDYDVLIVSFDCCSHSTPFGSVQPQPNPD